jgi:hypothetical protein
VIEDKLGEVNPAGEQCIRKLRCSRRSRSRTISKKRRARAANRNASARNASRLLERIDAALEEGGDGLPRRPLFRRREPGPLRHLDGELAQLERQGLLRERPPPIDRAQPPGY